MFIRNRFASVAASSVAAILCSVLALGIANAPAQFASAGSPAVVQTVV
jgi:hypothetical protein